MNKPELRKVYLEKRRSLTAAEYADLNTKLFNNFFQHIDLSKVKVMHSFLSISKNNEPDTTSILAYIKKTHPTIRIAIPKIQSDGKMQSYFFEHEDQLEISAWGIPEPKHGEVVGPKEFDLVLVPLLIFDKQKHRVGYGKGFYDIFLSTCNSDCQKIGLSFFEPVEKIDDIGTHDLALDYVVTPTGFY